MKWKEIPPKERGLVKGALRRVFFRSELRRKILVKYAVEHQDPKRPRVTAWVYCGVCGVVFPRYLANIDHIRPLIPVGVSLEDMEPTALVEGLWCDEENLQCIDIPCHKVKSKVECKARRDFRKEQKNGQRSSVKSSP
jgi:hypothetical protein